MLTGITRVGKESIFSDLGMRDIAYTTNLAYNQARETYAGDKAEEFYRLNLIVVLCGILMLYNILRLSVRQNIRFYGRVKSLGMTPRQIRVLAADRAAALTLPGLLPGWLLGFSLCAALAPYVVVGMEENPAFFFFQIWPFGGSALFTWGTVLTACLLPIRSAAKNTPAEAMRFVGGRKKIKKKTKGKVQRPVTIGRMAFMGLSMHRGQSVLAALSLFLSLTILCCAWTMGVSYDEEKYLDGMALSDYQIPDASAVYAIQRYNQKSRSITSEIIRALREHPAVTDIGIVCTMEVPMYAGEDERAPIVETFEGEDENGVVRKTHMADDPDWMAGYENMRESGAYTGIVTGVDGLALKAALSRDIFIEGAFSEEAFDTGKYVIAAGADSSFLRTTPPAGSKVVICGREFEIMASVPYESSLFSGEDSRQAQFNVTYYVPVSVFDELFPEHGIRSVLVNIDSDRKDAFEAFLSDILRDTGIVTTSVSDYRWYFRNALFHRCVIPLFVGAVMLFIGTLNFANVLAAGVFVRKEEFAVYESLGMTKGQLGRILLAEGMFRCGAMLLLLIPGIFSAVWLWGRWWLAHTNTWCVTWHFSLMPLWVFLPMLLAAALAVPLYFLKSVTRESVTQRLRTAE